MKSTWTARRSSCRHRSKTGRSRFVPPRASQPCSLRCAAAESAAGRAVPDDQLGAMQERRWTQLLARQAHSHDSAARSGELTTGTSECRTARWSSCPLGHVRQASGAAHHSQREPQRRALAEKWARLVLEQLASPSAAPRLGWSGMDDDHAARGRAGGDGSNCKPGQPSWRPRTVPSTPRLVTARELYDLARTMAAQSWQEADAPRSAWSNWKRLR